jgi:hypothetical protein
VSSAAAKVIINGNAAVATPAENGTRMFVTLDHAGHYQLAEH